MVINLSQSILILKMETKDGFLVINKEKGCTSHDCVKQTIKLLNTKKLGTRELLIQIIGHYQLQLAVQQDSFSISPGENLQEN